MTPTQITDKMMAADAFSQWLGIERLEDGLGGAEQIQAELQHGQPGGDAQAGEHGNTDRQAEKQGAEHEEHDGLPLS